MSDPQDALRLWLVRKLDERGYGSSQALADYLGTDPQVVSRMKNRDGSKQMRNIEAHFIPRLATFFGEVPPGFEILTELPVAATDEVNAYAVKRDQLRNHVLSVVISGLRAAQEVGRDHWEIVDDLYSEVPSSVRVEACEALDREVEESFWKKVERDLAVAA